MRLLAGLQPPRWLTASSCRGKAAARLVHVGGRDPWLCGSRGQSAAGAGAARIGIDRCRRITAPPGGRSVGPRRWSPRPRCPAKASRRGHESKIADVDAAPSRLLLAGVSAKAGQLGCAAASPWPRAAAPPPVAEASRIARRGLREYRASSPVAIGREILAACLSVRGPTATCDRRLIGRLACRPLRPRSGESLAMSPASSMMIGGRWR